MHFRHQWHPDRNEQTLEPGIGEAFLPVPGDLVVVRLGNAASIPKGLDNGFNLTCKRSDPLV